MLHLHTLAELVTTLSTQMRDPLDERWTLAEKQQALLDALDEWAGRVSCESVYTVPGGWTSNAMTYELPSYIDARTIEPQFQGAPTQWPVISWQSGDRRWQTLAGWRVVDGVLELTQRVDSPGRIIFWVTPQLPRTTAVVEGAHTATATTLAVQAIPDDAPEAGWVRCGNEWMSYAGLDRDGVALQNVGRAEKGLAAPISNGATLEWCICAPTPMLWQQLTDAARARLHEMFLTDASPRETSTHERMVQFYRMRSDQFWRGWTPQRRPRMIAEARPSL